MYSSTVRIYISVILTISSFFGSSLLSQEEITYAQKIYSMTTLIDVYFPQGKGVASGFYYQSGKDSYLVSNRHVFYPNESTPDSIIFHLRMDDSTGRSAAKWHPIRLDRKYLLSNLYLHKNINIDVASIKINDLLWFPGNSGIHMTFAVNLIDTALIDIINPEIGDDILIVGYPRGYYDDYNLIPIVKEGTIASFYRTNFKNRPYFVIDSKLYPGSSGSIVISKHKELFFSKGEPMFAPVKDFVFLGIFSGEPFIYGPQQETDEEVSRKKLYMDLGEVWYPWVLEELLLGLAK